MGKNKGLDFSIRSGDLTLSGVGEFVLTNTEEHAKPLGQVLEELEERVRQLERGRAQDQAVISSEWVSFEEPRGGRGSQAVVPNPEQLARVVDALYRLDPNTEAGRNLRRIIGLQAVQEHCHVDPITHGRSAADVLVVELFWGNTPQGGDYWNGVWYALRTEGTIPDYKDTLTRDALRELAVARTALLYLIHFANPEGDFRWAQLLYRKIRRVTRGVEPETTAASVLAMPRSERAQLVADAIINNLFWDHMPEGSYYWDEAHDKLLEIASGA